MILPWWSKYVAYLTILIWACGYTGIKVANHYQDKLAAIRVMVVEQERKVKVIETKQKEVVKNANTSIRSSHAVSDEYYRLRYPATSKMPDTSGTASGVEETTKAIDVHPACTAEGSADALTIIAWQKFYQDLMKAQETLSDP